MFSNDSPPKYSQNMTDPLSCLTEPFAQIWRGAPKCFFGNHKLEIWIRRSKAPSSTLEESSFGVTWPVAVSSFYLLPLEAVDYFGGSKSSVSFAGNN